MAYKKKLLNSIDKRIINKLLKHEDISTTITLNYIVRHVIKNPFYIR